MLKFLINKLTEQRNERLINEFRHRINKNMRTVCMFLVKSEKKSSDQNIQGKQTIFFEANNTKII